jgi:hypothetical protein
MTSLVPLLFYSPRVSARHRRYFKHEVDIVRPRVGVALGQAKCRGSTLPALRRESYRRPINNDKAEGSKPEHRHPESR